MLSDIKYLGLGLMIGILGTALVIAAIFFSTVSAPTPPATMTFTPEPTQQPSSTPVPPSPTPTPSSTPTFTPIPTLIVPTLNTTVVASTPTETPDPILSTIEAGGLIFSGPLSNAQQIALYRASLNYVQPTVKDSLRAAKEINGVGYGDPSNICGPLAIAILRDAGLIATDTIPHDFWLLNPIIPEDRKILDRTFPPDRYLYTKSTIPLNKMDWRTSPLQPGDFLFIWHGSWGNFDHILVVNRVDSNLRTYAVTNYGTPDGYIIAETMLYDPNDAHAGIFHTWTQERDAILGSTGFGGFELWRLRAP